MPTIPPVLAPVLEPLRRRAARTPRLRRRTAVFTAGLLVATAVAWSVAAALQRIDEEATRWGERREVVVLQRAVPAGEVIPADAVSMESRPVGLVPADAAGSIPEGARARVPLVPGEVLVAERTGGGGGIAARLAEGRRAVAVTSATAMPPITPGDRVEVWSAAASGPIGGSAAGRATSDAEVLTVGEDGSTGRAVTLAVEERDVAKVAGAALLGPVALVARPT